MIFVLVLVLMVMVMAPAPSVQPFFGIVINEILAPQASGTVAVCHNAARGSTPIPILARHSSQSTCSLPAEDPSPSQN